MDFYNLDKYNSYIMMEDRYVYCVSKTHRYACEKEITMDMLKDESIILFNTDSVQTQMVITCLRNAGITPNVRMYCSQLVTVLNFVRGGNCGAFLYSSLAPTHAILLLFLCPLKSPANLESSGKKEFSYLTD